MKYQVEIIETLIHIEDVDAYSEENAVDIVRAKYANEEIVLDSDCFVGADIQIHKED